MTDRSKLSFVRIVSLTLLVFIAIGGAVMAYPSFSRGRLLRRQEADLHRRIDAKKREISVLLENQRRFRTDADFVETIARQNRRVFPGELVFIFEDR